MANSHRKCTLKSCSAFERADTMVFTPVGPFCNHDHSYQYAREKAHKSRQKAERIERKVFKEKVRNFRLKDISHQKELTQAVANKLCSLLDAGKPCISCGRPLRGGRAQNASHFKSRGANSFLRYSMLNLHLGCVVCNLHQSGNLEGYRAGLSERFGQWIIDYLDNAPRSHEWDCAELIALRTVMNSEIRRIESGLSPSRNWRAIPMTAQEQ